MYYRVMNKQTGLVTSVMVNFGDMHDTVRIWNRGGLAGELTVKAGDGEIMAKRLMGSPDAWRESPHGERTATWWSCTTCGVVGIGIENRPHHRCDR